jgi:hypothetical protein
VKKILLLVLVLIFVSSFVSAGFGVAGGKDESMYPGEKLSRLFILQNTIEDTIWSESVDVLSGDELISFPDGKDFDVETGEFFKLKYLLSVPEDAVIGENLNVILNFPFCCALSITINVIADPNDSDADGIPNSDDFCPDTVGVAIAKGCSCEQILEFMPGISMGNKCGQGVLNVFVNQLGWARNL